MTQSLPSDEEQELASDEVVGANDWPPSPSKLGCPTFEVISAFPLISGPRVGLTELK